MSSIGSAVGGVTHTRKGIFYGWNIVGAAFVINALAACLHPVVFSFFIGPMSDGLGFSRSTLS